MKRHLSEGWLEILSLIVGLLGTASVATIAYLVKYTGASLPRFVFLLALGLSVAPIYGALRGRSPLFFAVPPVIVVMLLYAFFNPHGLPFWRDPIFNFQFSRSLVEAGSWIPGDGTIAATTYSYYPLENMYNASASVILGLPLEMTFLWAMPIMRFLIVPAAVFSYSRRLFDSRVAVLAVVTYLGASSITFGIPVQQEFALPFMALTLMLLSIQAGQRKPDLALALLVILFSSAIVATHHLSSYVFGLWMAALVFLPFLMRRSGVLGSMRLPSVMGRYVVVLMLYIYFLTANIVRRQFDQLYNAILNVVQIKPIPGQVSTLGRTFEPYELVWLVGSIAVVLIVSLLAIRRLFPAEEHTFAVVNGIFGIVLTVSTFPLLPSSFFFLPLRVSEYSYLALAPLVGWALLSFARGFASKAKAPERPWAPWRDRPWRIVVPAILLFVIVTGGNLAPLSTRQYFEAPPQETSIDSPLFVDGNARDAAQWARGHLNVTRPIWGDELVLSVYGGFGKFNMKWGQFSVFNGSSLDQQSWRSLSVGDYVVIDRYMTVITPSFRDTVTPRANGPLSTSQVEKFAHSPYFAVVYQDSTYTVYMVVRTPSLPTF